MVHGYWNQKVAWSSQGSNKGQIPFFSETPLHVLGEILTSDFLLQLKQQTNAVCCVWFGKYSQTTSWSIKNKTSNYCPYLRQILTEFSVLFFGPRCVNTKCMTRTLCDWSCCCFHLSMSWRSSDSFHVFSADLVCTVTATIIKMLPWPFSRSLLHSGVGQL